MSTQARPKSPVPKLSGRVLPAGIGMPGRTPQIRAAHARRRRSENRKEGTNSLSASERHHILFLLPVSPFKVVITCHYCGEAGHKVSHCQKMPPEMRESQLGHDSALGYISGGYRPYGQPSEFGKKFKNLDEIVCFKCGEMGHFANKCPKGHLAFLSVK